MRASPAHGLGVDDNKDLIEPVAAGRAASLADEVHVLTELRPFVERHAGEVLA